MGESQANGAVAKAFQGLQGKIRAIKVDVELATGIIINTAHLEWPWLVKLVAQMLLLWRVNP